MAALGALVAGVAHELNTPIGAMAGSIDVIRRAAERLRTASNPEEVERVREVIAKLTRTTAESCGRVEDIVRNLRAFARLDEAEAKVVDLHQGIESTLALLRHLTDRRIRVERRYGALPPLACVPSQLNQVFMHLLTNACQAIEGEGIITVATDLHQGKARIRVSDTGRGIPPGDLARVFDPGFTTKRGVGVGLGLGLSISQRVVSTHGGTIEVESAAGGGSTFTVVLPLGRAATAAGEPGCEECTVMKVQARIVVLGGALMLLAAPAAAQAPDSAAAPPAPSPLPAASPSPPANTPIEVLANFEQAWRTGAADAVLECVSRHEVELALERTGPPGGRFPCPQAEFLIRDLLHYGETLEFKIVHFEWEDDAPRARAEWVHRMASGEIRERLDLGLGLEGGRWCIVRIAAH